MIKRRIMVLGAAGFIGRRVIEELSRDPTISPVAIVRRTHGTFSPSVEVVVQDARDAPGLTAAIEGAAGIVNCVAGDAESIVGGARALAAAVNATGTRPRVVHLSSLAVYGNATGTVDETARLNGDLSEYAAAKIAAEEALSGLQTLVTLRPGIVYGPGSPLWSGYIGRLLSSGRLGHLGENGEGICNLTYVDDLVRAILSALTMSGIEGGIFNVSASAAPTWNEYFRRYALALDAPPLKSMSKVNLIVETALISPALKIAELVAGSKAPHLPPAIRPWLLAHCRHRIKMEVSRAEKTFQMTWEPAERGLGAAASWFRDTVQA